MLNPNAQKWVEALRSREYKQGHGALHVISLSGEHRFCCLGVACEVAMKNGVNLEVKEVEGVFCYNRVSGYLPGIVAEWLDLDSTQATYKSSLRPMSNLTSHNDDDHWTFAKIADLIESEPAGLFKE